MIDELLMDMYRGAAKELIEGVRCAGCNKPAEAHVLVVRADGEMMEHVMCKGHLLDPGPLLDW